MTHCQECCVPIQDDEGGLCPACWAVRISQRRAGVRSDTRKDRDNAADE